MCSIKKVESKLFDVYDLDWDTQYFGLSSAKAILKSNIPKKERTTLKRYLDKFQFVTILNEDNNAYNNVWIGEETQAFLCDLNVQFMKDVGKIPSFTPIETCEIFEAYPYNEQITEIAKSAFSYSRFFNDPNLSKRKAYNIYAHWVESAFDKNGKYFVVFNKGKSVGGFLLFSINEKSKDSVIELIAVNEASRGLKIGKVLLQTLEQYLCRKGIEKIKVGTQVNNISAINFYAHNNFNYESCNSVYHYWPKIDNPYEGI
ncbi:GNAT family N-acetyltransferase [Tepidanaerobacter sp. EBM-49]|uniref:GNAT family N-acetyltransferase n=1 Tax=Tepidanaerobacter sp. EBM-49 TaxID=1918504 RepID=UPI00257C2321|nr:GNAT family N-acetyltransferase [Tepidanaerobacter sp. EBM-49]